MLQPRAKDKLLDEFSRLSNISGGKRMVNVQDGHIVLGLNLNLMRD